MQYNHIFQISTSKEASSYNLGFNIITFLQISTFRRRKSSATSPERGRAEGTRRFTLLSDFDLSTPKFCLFDVFHTEITAALGVLLLLVSGGGLIVRAVGVGGSWGRTGGQRGSRAFIFKALGLKKRSGIPKLNHQTIPTTLTNHALLPFACLIKGKGRNIPTLFCLFFPPLPPLLPFPSIPLLLLLLFFLFSSSFPSSLAAPWHPAQEPITHSSHSITQSPSPSSQWHSSAWVCMNTRPGTKITPRSSTGS